MSFSEKTVELLKKSRTELEEFRVRLSLGKMDAADEYEEMKKNLREQLHDTRLTLTGFEKENREKIRGLGKKIEQLQLQLAPGKASSRKIFSDRMKNAAQAVHAVREDLRDREMVFHETFTHLAHAVELFMIKLQMLQLKIKLGQYELSEKWEEMKNKLARHVNEFRLRMHEKEGSLVRQWGGLNEEISSAYKNFLSVFEGE